MVHVWPALSRANFLWRAHVRFNTAHYSNFLPRFGDGQEECVFYPGVHWKVDYPHE